MSLAVVPTPTPAELWDALRWAREEGSDREFTLAMRDYLLDAILRHTAAAGCPVSDKAAQVCANNLATGLAELCRG